MIELGASVISGAAALVVDDILFGNGVRFVCTTRGRGRSTMHATKMQGKQILAIEIIVVNFGTIMRVGSRGAKIAAPKP